MWTGNAVKDRHYQCCALHQQWQRHAKDNLFFFFSFSAPTTSGVLRTWRVRDQHLQSGEARRWHGSHSSSQSTPVGPPCSVTPSHTLRSPAGSSSRWITLPEWAAAPYLLLSAEVNVRPAPRSTAHHISCSFPCEMFLSPGTASTWSKALLEALRSFFYVCPPQ